MFCLSIKCNICKIKVDFPIPGSPPINMTEPGTIPPPSKRSNSSIDVSIVLAIILSGGIVAPSGPLSYQLLLSI